MVDNMPNSTQDGEENEDQDNYKLVGVEDLEIPNFNKFDKIVHAHKESNASGTSNSYRTSSGEGISYPQWKSYDNSHQGSLNENMKKYLPLDQDNISKKSEVINNCIGSYKEIYKNKANNNMSKIGKNCPRSRSPIQNLKSQNVTQQSSST